MSDVAKAKLGWLDYFRLLIRGRAALEEAIAQGKIVKAEAHKAGVKTLGFWVSVLSGLGAVAAQVGGVVPPPWGAVVLASSGALYAVARGLKKRDDPLGGVKPALSASENWANILAALGQVALAVSGAVDPQTAAVLVSAHAAAVAFADNLAKSGAQPEESRPPAAP